MNDSIGRCAVHGGEISRVAPEKREIRENHLRAARYDASVSCVGGRDSIRSAGYLRPDTFYMYVHMYVRVYTHACKLYLYYLANFTRQGTARHATRPAAGIKSLRDLSETSSQCKFRGEKGIFIVRKNQVSDNSEYRGSQPQFAITSVSFYESDIIEQSSFLPFPLKSHFIFPYISILIILIQSIENLN